MVPKSYKDVFINKTVFLHHVPFKVLPLGVNTMCPMILPSLWTCMKPFSHNTINYLLQILLNLWNIKSLPLSLISSDTKRNHRDQGWESKSECRGMQPFCSWPWITGQTEQCEQMQCCVELSPFHVFSGYFHDVLSHQSNNWHLIKLVWTSLDMLTTIFSRYYA
jgi:hypothetical protein